MSWNIPGVLIALSIEREKKKITNLIKIDAESQK